VSDGGHLTYGPPDPQSRRDRREPPVSLESGDDVLVVAPPVAEDLVVAIHELIGDVGANPVTLL